MTAVPVTVTGICAVVVCRLMTDRKRVKKPGIHNKPVFLSKVGKRYFFI